MGQPATGNEFEVAGETKDRETVTIGPNDVGELTLDELAPEQAPNTPSDSGIQEA